MPVDRVLLAVDFSNFLYRSCAAYSKLSHDGEFTGGLYGFLVGLTHTINRVAATDVVICLDSKPYRRSDSYPEYKAMRKEKQDDTLRDLYKFSEPLVKRLVTDYLPCALWAIPGFEADDLIAVAVRREGWRFNRIVAACNDSDIHQLLDHPNFSIAKGADKPLLHGAHDWRSEHGLTARQFAQALAFSGTHNEVEGIKGVGPAKSAAIVKDAAKFRAAMAEHGDMYRRNIKLIELPHPDLRGKVLLPREKIRFNARALYRFAGEFGIDITGAMLSALEQVAS